MDVEVVSEQSEWMTLNKGLVGLDSCVGGPFHCAGDQPTYKAGRDLVVNEGQEYLLLAQDLPVV